ncbi:hypothetical protein MBLNU230_g6496t1 [Neophaeotheca triangularis]
MSAHVKPKEARQQSLLRYHELPPWQRDNEYLLSGYRPTSGSWLGSFKSMFAWHNETINIHSHTVGAALFAWLPVHFYTTTYQKATDPEPTEAVLFTLYFLGVAICFASSAWSTSPHHSSVEFATDRRCSCHIIWNLSPPAAALGNRLDFCGIVLLMWGASLPSIHYAFICEPSLERLHWALVSFSAFGCILFTLHPSFLGPTFRKYRALMYSCFGLSAVFFISHSILLYGFAVQKRRLALEWMALTGVLNLLGAAFYASRLPEAWFPHRFDFVGASHQIFHLLVFAAGIAHYKGLTCAFWEARVSQSLCDSAAPSDIQVG